MESDLVLAIISLVSAVVTIIAAIYVIRMPFKKAKILEPIIPDLCLTCNISMKYNKFMSSWNCKECGRNVHLFLDANKNVVKAEMKKALKKGTKQTYLIMILIFVIVFSMNVLDIAWIVFIALGILLVALSVLSLLGVIKMYSAYSDEFLNKVKFKYSLRKMGMFAGLAYLLLATILFAFGFYIPLEFSFPLLSLMMVVLACLMYIFENNIEYVRS